MMGSVGHVTASAKLKAAGLMNRVSLLLLLTPAFPPYSPFSTFLSEHVPSGRFSLRIQWV